MYTLEITLKSIEVKENGTINAIEGVNALSATLFFPKAGIPSVETIRKFKLKDNEVKDLSGLPFQEKLIFKQEFEGSCILKLTLTSIDEVSKFDKIMLNILNKVAPAVVGTVTGGIFTAIATNVAASIFEFAEPNDQITIIGEGEFPITADIQDRDLPIHLNLPKALELSRMIEKDGQLVKQTFHLAKGAGNAQVLLNLKRIDTPQMIAGAALSGQTN